MPSPSTIPNIENSPEVAPSLAETKPNLSGEQMLGIDCFLDEQLSQPGITPDARVTLLDSMTQNMYDFTIGAKYAQAQVDAAAELGHKLNYFNPLLALVEISNQTNTLDQTNFSEQPTSPEIADHAELKEKLTASFQSGYEAYCFAVDNKNQGKDIKDQIALITPDQARDMWELKCTQQYLDSVAARIEADKLLPGNEVEGAVNYRIGFSINADYTAAEESALAEAVQNISPLNRWKKGSYNNSNYHNDTTANKANKDQEATASVVLSPDHFNLPNANVKEQFDYQLAQNQVNPDTTMRSYTGVEALTNIYDLSVRGELDNKDTIFPKTYTRRVDDYQEDSRGQPLDGCVGNVYAYDDSQVGRGYSSVSAVYGARALVV
jgi:hypothetical protein